VPSKKNPAPKLVISKKWNMPITPGDTPGRMETLPIRPGDKPGVWTNLSKTNKRRTTP